MTVKPAPVISATRFRPIRSERLPKIGPPIGRPSRVTVNTSVSSVARVVSDMLAGSK